MNTSLLVLLFIRHYKNTLQSANINKTKARDMSGIKKVYTKICSPRAFNSNISGHILKIYNFIYTKAQLFEGLVHCTYTKT